MHALQFLESVKRHAGKPVFVIFGDEGFLKRRVGSALRHAVLGDRQDEFCWSRFNGPSASLVDVLDEVSTVPLLGGRRLVEVDDADSFVTSHRQRLEQYLETPSSQGALVLEVKSWPANTRLAKAVAKKGVAIECRSLRPREAPAWAARWARSEFDKKLQPDAAELLVELAGTDLGVLSGELEKLTAYVGRAATITAEDVETLVGGWSVKTRWQMLDAAAEGRVADALAMLDRLLTSGEAPIALLGAVSWQLRLLARASRLAERGMPLRKALAHAGVKPFVLDRAQSQLRRLGRARAARLYRQLLDADLGLKGDSTLPPSTVLERLLVQVSADAA